MIFACIWTYWNGFWHDAPFGIGTNFSGLPLDTRTLWRSINLAGWLLWQLSSAFRCVILLGTSGQTAEFQNWREEFCLELLQSQLDPEIVGSSPEKFFNHRNWDSMQIHPRDDLWIFIGHHRWWTPSPVSPVWFTHNSKAGGSERPTAGTSWKMLAPVSFWRRQILSLATSWVHRGWFMGS